MGHLLSPKNIPRVLTFSQRDQESWQAKTFPTDHFMIKPIFLHTPYLGKLLPKKEGREVNLSPYCFKSVEDSILLWLLSTLMFLLKFPKSGHSNPQCFENPKINHFTITSVCTKTMFVRVPTIDLSIVFLRFHIKIGLK